MAIAFIARFLMIAAMSLIPIAITGVKKWRLSFYEINIIWFAGLIRGSVAYALIQGLELEVTKDVSSFQDFQNLSNAKQSAAIVKSTILLLVILSTVILGALMPLVIKVNIAAQEKAEAAKDPLRQSLQVVHYQPPSR